MKIRHRVPTREPQSATLTPDYQAEVDQAVARSEAAYRRAEKRLRAAEARLAKVRQSPQPKRAHVAHMEALVELRRVELEQVHRLMVATAYPAANRGVKSFRPVPNPGGPL